MKTMMKNILVLVLAVLFLPVLSACGAAATGNTAPTPAAAVQTENYVSATGVIVPARWTMLSIPATGVVEEVAGKENQVFN